MKIAIVVHSLFPIRTPYKSNLERRSHLLAISLRSLGHQVDLYAHPASDKTLLVKPKSYPYKGTVYFDTGPEITGTIDGTFWYPNLYSQIDASHYDIVHIQTFQQRPNPIGSFTTSPIITTLHHRNNLFFDAATSRVKNKVYGDIIHISKRLENCWNHTYKIIYNDSEPAVMVTEYLQLYNEFMTI